MTVSVQAQVITAEVSVITTKVWADWLFIKVRFRSYHYMKLVGTPMNLSCNFLWPFPSDIYLYLRVLRMKAGLFWCRREAAVGQQSVTWAALVGVNVIHSCRERLVRAKWHLLGWKCLKHLKPTWKYIVWVFLLLLLLKTNRLDT